MKNAMPRVRNVPDTPEPAMSCGRERRGVDRGEAEAGDHEAGDETTLARVEPLDRCRCGACVGEADTHAGQDAEADR